MVRRKTPSIGRKLVSCSSPKCRGFADKITQILGTSVVVIVVCPVTRWQGVRGWGKCRKGMVKPYMWEEPESTGFELMKMYRITYGAWGEETCLLSFVSDTSKWVTESARWQSMRLQTLLSDFTLMPPTRWHVANRLVSWEYEASASFTSRKAYFNENISGLRLLQVHHWECPQSTAHRHCCTWFEGWN